MTPIGHIGQAAALAVTAALAFSSVGAAQQARTPKKQTAAPKQPSPEQGRAQASGGQPTLLGAKQWAWLQEGLRRSKATFKVLACGMIWDDKENSEKDDWGTYLAERRALERFILTERIPGVILMGGDIHASRVLRYNSKAAVGYDLVQFIASPVHGSVIPSLNVYNPHLVRSAVEPHVFLLVEADDTVSPARLDATLINARGARVFHYQLTIEDLTPA